MNFILTLSLIIGIYAISIITSMSIFFIIKYFSEIIFYINFVYLVIINKIYFWMEGEYRVGAIFIDNGNILRVIEKDISLKCSECFCQGGNWHEGIICKSKSKCESFERFDKKSVVFIRIGIMYKCSRCAKFNYYLDVKNYESYNECSIKVYNRLSHDFSITCKKGELFVYKNKYLRLLNFLKGGITLFDEKEKLK